MQAIRVSATGGPDALQLEDIPIPEPGPGQIRIKVEAAGVNFVEIYQRKGQYTLPLPFTPGGEAAGRVDAVASDVSSIEVGARVAAMDARGAYAQYTLIQADQAVPLPEGVNAEVAAAVMTQGITAHFLAHSVFKLEAGQTALIHAAAGGVGQLLVQIAKKRGARVIGTVGSVEKAQIARDLGADEVILYNETDFEAETKRLTNGVGVDVVYDSVGRTTFEKGLNVLKPRGLMALFGQSSGPVAPLDPQILNAKGSLYLTRPTYKHYIATREELLWRAQDIFGWIAAGELRVRIDKTFPLAQAPSAHQYLEDRKTQGKVLLLPW
ncbi:MAG TPA: quinone oxidoreductase [Ktedonobacterales bacterium]|jgi:NADPH:quinone reductase|nr:quinone oxidoreductase [Ktedonobacterales bacterium]